MQIDNSFHEELETEEVKINGREKKGEKKKKEQCFSCRKNYTLPSLLFFPSNSMCV